MNWAYTPLRCVNQILAQNGFDCNNYDPNNDRCWSDYLCLNTVHYTTEKQADCAYMTTEERDFFLKLFQNKSFRFELRENFDVDGKKVENMCGELIYYFR